MLPLGIGANCCQDTQHRIPRQRALVDSVNNDAYLMMIFPCDILRDDQEAFQQTLNTEVMLGVKVLELLRDYRLSIRAPGFRASDLSSQISDDPSEE